MAQAPNVERRKFVRIGVELPVQYKFVALELRKKVDDGLHEGFTRDLSQGGLLLIGTLPILDWISPLLMSKMVIGLSFELPGLKRPIQALGQTAWVEAVEEKSRRTAFGLFFREIAEVDRDHLLQFVLRSQV